MNELTFEGPLHQSKLVDAQIDLDFEGVYIWGFMVDKNYRPINCHKKHEYKPDEMTFLPYYVGMATGKGKGKSVMTVKKRLINHKVVEKGNGAKYLRINENHLRSFNNDDDFPIHVGKKSHYKEIIKFNLKHGERAISYYNNPLFMFHLHKDKLRPRVHELFNVKTHNKLPINDEIFSRLPIKDPLKIITKDKDNFWFVCANVKHLDHKNDEKYFENLEGITYYSLKGKTISVTKQFQFVQLLSDHFKIIDHTKTNIFKDQPSKNFPGYEET